MNVILAINKGMQKLSPITEVPRLEAEILLAYVLNLTRSQLYIAYDQELTPIILKKYESFVERRKKGEPIAYIIGRKEFWSLELEVTSDTLIPRPETELLVELALERPGLLIADIGTGTGAIALSIASERPESQVYATDISLCALQVAKRNASRLNISNVHFYQGNDFLALPSLLFDIIVSNPPYLKEEDEHLKQGDLRYEPRSALIGGKKGTEIIQSMISSGRPYLKAGGWLLIEHAYDQGNDCRCFFKQNNYVDVQTSLDLTGLERVTLGRKNK